MKTNSYFGEIQAIDAPLASKATDGAYLMRYRDSSRIILHSVDGRILNIVQTMHGCAPDTLVCSQIPGADIELPEDGWILTDKTINIPFVTQIDYSSASRFKSDAIISITDFPGHMKKLISRQTYKTAAASRLEAFMPTLISAIQSPLVEMLEEPIIRLVGSGDGSPAAGDTALSGLLLTARVFAAGNQLDVHWYKRLAVEVRRFLHRTNIYGRNWLTYAIEGRMSELQQSFFAAMSRDIEGNNESAIKNLTADTVINGEAFLIGAGTALEIIQSAMLRSENSK